MEQQEMESSVMFNIIHEHAKMLARQFLVNDMSIAEVREHIFNVHANPKFMKAEFDIFAHILMQAHAIIFQA